MSAWVSPPQESVSHMVEVAAIMAHAASTALPPRSKIMAPAVAAKGFKVRRLPSGAGHDGMAIGAIAEICMLFVRCKGGVSHNPPEAITEADAAAGAAVLLESIEKFEA